MGKAREIMDRLIAAMTAKDSAAQAACYTVDAVAVTPDQGEILGRVLHVSWGDDARVASGDDGVLPDRTWFQVVGGVRLTSSG